MRLVLCTGENNSVLFNNRRVYRDALVLMDILDEVYCSGEVLFMSPYSYEMFKWALSSPCYQDRRAVHYFNEGCSFIRASEDFLREATAYGNCYCFVEQEFELFEHVTDVIQYMRHRTYPVDLTLKISGFVLDNEQDVLGTEGLAVKRRFVLPCGGRSYVACSRG